MGLQIVFLKQDSDTYLQRLAYPGFLLRYASARSNESRSMDETGQDALCFAADERFVFFALCDGVGMSFMGNLAARCLSQKMVEWLVGQHQNLAHNPDAQADCTQFLQRLTEPGSRIVANYRLPDGLPQMILSVLEDKRSAGSESMFVSGALDLQEKTGALFWMGDSRLRIWQEKTDQTSALFGSSFQTQERWSTLKGPVGPVHAWQGSLDGISRVAAYSDGLAILDGKMNAPYADNTLNEIFTAVGSMPNSDDISYFEVNLAKETVR